MASANNKNTGMFTQLTEAQEVAGGTIEALIRNFKKDSAIRKNVRYYEDRLRRLDTAWAEFESTDNKIRCLDQPLLDHEYFCNNYYQTISDLVVKYRDLFEAALLSSSTELKDAPPSATIDNSRNMTRPGEDASYTAGASPIISLIRRQNVMMESLKRTLTMNPNADNMKLKEKLWEQIETLHLSVLENSQNPLIDGYDMEAYTTLEARVFENFRKVSQVASESGAAHDQPNGLPLPKITIPKFNSDYLKWRTFYDLFLQLVHNQRLPSVHKMWYLKSNVSGEAERLISHLSATADNYEAAWSLLKERYDNKRVLVASLIQQLLDQPSVGPSVTAIKQLHDTTQECLHALQNLGIDTTSWDPMLLHLLIKKLDRNLHSQYERSIINPKDLQQVKHFLSFLETRFQSMEAMGQKEKPPLEICISTASSKPVGSNCTLCKLGSHQLFRCERFQQLNPHERLSVVQKQNLCVNCLRNNHTAKQCTSRGCTKCNRKHNSLLHLESRNDPSKGKEEKPQTTSFTATKIIEAAANHEIPSLGITRRPSMVKINGIGSTNTKTQHRVNVSLHSRTNGFSTQVEAFVLPRIISPQPAQFINTSAWPLPKNLVLGDPNFNRPDKIDLLLGAEHFLQLLSVGQIQLSSQLPVLKNTVLGWIISGKLQEQHSTDLSCGVSTADENLEASIAKLWELDEIKTPERTLSLAQKQCEELFLQHTTRNQENRFVVRIPFHQSESYNIALNRFLSLEHRLQKHPELKRNYTKFMDEYEAMEHMTKISPDSIRSPHYFIPHHSVLRPTSTTTKLRVVFDASAKTTSGQSLNDLMHTGPIVQSELFSILLRFRLPRFVFSTDVEEMYRQILIAPEDRQLHLIIWRKDVSEPLTYFQLNTVTYGTRSAPYLATNCLQQLAKENSAQYPLASQFLQQNFYVDDGIGGSDYLSTALLLQEQLQRIMKQHGFNLRKWCANHPQLLKNVPQGDLELNLDFESTKSNSTSTLGLTWLPKEDQLCITVNISDSKRITKRTVTSDLAKIFDPLGLLSPIAVTAKMFIQELWKLKLDWDQALPESMHTKWATFRADLTELKTLNMPRHIFFGGCPTSIQLHIFSDASEKAYGAASYLRSTMKNGIITTRLLCGKSRVAPLKTQTIPRLELCAAALAAQLSTRIVTDLQLTGQVFLWTDSEIVLSWINSASSLHTFVANRTSIILDNTRAEQWRHVSTKCNPADILSRGIAPRYLKDCSIWFYGPLFLHGHESSWPPSFNPSLATPTNLERKIKQALVMTSATPDFIYKINHKNSFWRLQHIVGYILRFIHNIKGKGESRQLQRSLSTAELRNAQGLIIKQMQASEFKEEIQHLTKYKELRGSSCLGNLSPFLDAEDLIRVGGRLQASPLDYDSKHQFLIPYNDPIANLMFEMFHKNNKHCGAQTLLGIIRQQFWPIKGKIMARATIHRCILCSKAKPALYHQILGDLPAARVTPARPFINSGVDYCGPITVHYKLRGKRHHKAYIAVFCCFSTKVVHLELVSDLTTDAFIGAIKRFVGRRGHCQHLYCDNATNFVGAKNKLAELSSAIHTDDAKEAIGNACSKQGMQFHFIPPRAPHFGGLWEAAVKSAKHLLIRSLANASLTYEELETLIIEIEAINQLKLAQLFSMGMINLSFIANNLQQIQACILDALTDTHHGKVNPLLLTPSQLETEIHKIKTHLPQSLDLPVQKNNLLEFYKLMKIKGGLTREHVVFSITLPLIDHEKFQLFNILPVPTAVNNTMLMIDTCSTTLAINPTRQHYFPLAQSQLKNCDTLSQDEFICYDVQLQYHFGAEMYSCEINLFSNVTAPQCLLKKLPTNVTWAPLTQKNQWIYASLTSTHATAVCEKEIISINLLGSGLLTLNPNCILKHEFIYMYGQQSISTKTTLSYTSLGSISELEFQPIERIHHIDNTNHSSVAAELAGQLTKLNDLQQKLDSINNRSEFHPHSSSKHSVPAAYSAITISAIVVIYILIRAVKCKKSKRTQITSQAANCNQQLATSCPAPSPAPRQKFTVQL